jgi:hypothetical protein
MPNRFSLDYVKQSLEAFLRNDPDCSLSWIKCRITVSKISVDELKCLLFQLKGYGDQDRYDEIYSECSQRGFKSDLICDKGCASS